MDPGTLVGGRFIVERRAASGGMGAVFRARDLLTDGVVALKTLHSTEVLDVERFEREAKILSTLEHPGIVRYVAHGLSPGGDRYFAMEWLEGEDLSVRLARGPLSAFECVTLLRLVADALGHANAKGIVHRDIKPPNIFLVAGDVRRLKVLDFGIARPNRETARLTYTGAVVGTPGYMAPEQLQGQPAREPNIDVFSLGCVAFEGLTGRPAFEGAHLMAALAKVLFHSPPLVRTLRPDVPEPLESLVARMMAKRPDERPADGNAVSAELAEMSVQLDTWVATPSMLAPGTIVSSVSAPGRGSTENSLTLREQRLVSLVLAGDADAGSGEQSKEPEVWTDAAEIRAMVTACGATLLELRRDALVVVVSGPGSAVDRAERAAQCALALNERLPELPICVTTGRGVASAELIEGNVIDAGVRSLRATAPGAVRLDDVTASMVGARFNVRREADGLYLDTAINVREEVPRLLGKPSPWVGRMRELRALEGVLEGCALESLASAVLVIGPAGAGKSRLRTELLLRAQKDNPKIKILIGRASSVAAGSPFGMIADAIRRTANIHGGEPLEMRCRKLVARLGAHLEGEALANAAAFLGEIIGAPFPDSKAKRLRAARQDMMLMNDAIRAAWEDWIAAECSAEPMIFVLEDLHWGDAATVRLVDATLRNLHDFPLMLLVLARPEVHDVFPQLWPDRDVQVIKLGPLPPKASAELVRSALGEEVSPETVHLVVERAGGNPFFLEEIIRTVASGNISKLPDSVLGTVEARLDAEGSDAKLLLRAASIFGDRFSKFGVAALLGGEANTTGIEATMQALVSRELIAKTPDHGPLASEYTFRHSIVREACYAMLTERDRALGHRLAAEWLERTGHDDAVSLADHFRRGDTPERAVPWYRRAAEQALEANELSVTLERAARAVELGAEGEELGAVRLLEAEAYVWSAALVEAEQRANEAIALLSPHKTMWYRAISVAIRASGKRGETDKVAEWAIVASAEAIGEEALRAQTMCLSFCASYLVFGGRYPEADELILRLDKISAADTDPQLAAVLQELLAFRASAAGDPGACLQHLQVALPLFEQAGDLRNACSTSTNLGFILTELGDFEAAETIQRSALVSARRLGLSDVEGFVLQNLGQTLLYGGNLTEALEVERRAVEVLSREGAVRGEGVARAYVAKISLAAGDYVTAEHEAREATRLLDAVPPMRPVALAVLARILIAADRREEALMAAREANDALLKLGSLEEGEATVRLTYVEALLASGRTVEAKAALSAARDQLVANANKISDPDWRERFLSQVPDNARILALFQDECGGPREAQVEG